MTVMIPPSPLNWKGQQRRILSQVITAGESFADFWQPLNFFKPNETIKFNDQLAKTCPKSMKLTTWFNPFYPSLVFHVEIDLRCKSNNWFLYGMKCVKLKVSEVNSKSSQLLLSLRYIKMQIFSIRVERSYYGILTSTYPVGN